LFWNIGDMAATTSDRIFATFTVNPTTPNQLFDGTQLPMRAWVTDADGNVASSVDLTLYKTEPGPTSPYIIDLSGGPRNLRIGVVETIVYIIKVTNESGMATTGVTINDALPPGLDFVNSDPGPTTISGNLISINVGTLQPGETRLVQVEAELGPTATAGSTLTNRAYVVDSQGNSAQASFTGSVRTGTVTDNGRLSLSLTMPKTLTIAGGKDGTLKSSITITNGSRSDLQNVIVTLDGPPTAIFDSATPGPTMSGSGSLTWVFPTFNGHANVAIKLSQKVSATVADGTSLSFHAAVRSDDGRTDSDSTTVTVRNKGS
jgi:uncharacterized repeat protein (TIGR01451 family)